MHLLQKWARAYRDGSYHAAVNTNNGAESLNKVLNKVQFPSKKEILDTIKNNFTAYRRFSTNKPTEVLIPELLTIKPIHIVQRLLCLITCVDDLAVQYYTAWSEKRRHSSIL